MKKGTPMEINPIWYTVPPDTPVNGLLTYKDPNDHAERLVEVYVGGTCRVRRDVFMNNGEPHDKDIFDEAGILIRSRRVIPGTNLHKVTEFSAETSLVQVETIRNNFKEIISTTMFLYKNKILIEKSQFDKKGLRSGKTSYYDDSGKLYKETEFKEGLPHGVNKDYRDDGYPLSSTRYYDHGDLLSITRYDSFGNEI